MATEFDEQYQQVETGLHDLQQAIGVVGQKKGIERQEKIEDLKASAEMVKNDIFLAENEIMMLKESDKTIAKGKLQKAKQSLRDCNELISNLNRQTHVMDQGDEGDQPRVFNDMQKVKGAHLLLQAGNANLKDAEKAIDQTIEVNNVISENLVAQVDKLNRVSDDLTAMQGDVQLAKKQVKRLVQRLMNNKCYVAILFLVGLVLVGLTVWDLVKTLQPTPAPPAPAPVEPVAP